MGSDSTTEARWPVLRERRPFADPARHDGRRKTARAPWLLTGLAFLCGGLVSAAIFSIGWRHQAQRDTAARSALAAATARVGRLSQRTAELRASLVSARGTAARAEASQRALAQAGARVGTTAAATRSKAGPISSAAGTLTAAASRIASELETLHSYLTTTPAGSLDPGYIASQTGYLARQLARLQADADDLDRAVTSFETALRKLERDARAVS